jgi:hypothetical protein
MTHPQPLKLISALITEQGGTEGKQNRLDLGERLPIYSKTQYERHNIQLQNVIRDYNTYTETQFLDACCYHFDL